MALPPAVRALAKMRTPKITLDTLTAQVADVDGPLLSVGQVVSGGNTVVFSPSGCYIDLAAKKGPSGNIPAKRIPLRSEGNVYKLKMWVPKQQSAGFQGPAQA